MLRVLLLIVVLGVGMQAGEWNYRIRSPLLGTLGILHFTKTEKGRHYRIVGEARSAGLVKVLWGNRQERYLSEGKIVKGKLHSRTFLIERKSRKKEEQVRYSIDSVKHRIVKSRIRRKKGRAEEKSRKVLTYFSTDDLATLYFNLFPPRLAAGKELEAWAAGAEKIGGRVTVRIPTVKEAQEERKKLGVGPESGIVYLIAKKKLFGKAGRKIVAALDRDGIVQKAYLIAVPVVGKIYLERQPR
ncbi:DUF3108 domain-containing protein [Nitratifractor sp.]|uniref:DUF3108 domain-containing protein n=1 Tax=Nitratifractor sp. TaxID=2268144 RepID=UPI0025F69614|nr:DUF3108 domain-containing protein [Nitratifractor sp.]